MLLAWEVYLIWAGLLEQIKVLHSGGQISHLVYPKLLPL